VQIAFNRTDNRLPGGLDAFASSLPDGWALGAAAAFISGSKSLSRATSTGDVFNIDIMSSLVMNESS
jgi:hypothetical protein